LYVLKNASLPINQDIGTPLLPFQQLLINMPIASSAMLPDEYARFMNDLSSPLRSPVEYFPDEFQVDPFGGVWEYEFIAKIPFISD